MKIQPSIKLVRETAKKSGVTQEVARRVLVQAFTEILQAGTTNVKGFGTFYRSVTQAHAHKDPRTGEINQIPTVARLALRTSRSRREVLSGD